MTSKFDSPDKAFVRNMIFSSLLVGVGDVSKAHVLLLPSEFGNEIPLWRAKGVNDKYMHMVDLKLKKLEAACKAQKVKNANLYGCMLSEAAKHIREKLAGEKIKVAYLDTCQGLGKKLTAQLKACFMGNIFAKCVKVAITYQAGRDKCIDLKYMERADTIRRLIEGWGWKIRNSVPVPYNNDSYPMETLILDLEQEKILVEKVPKVSREQKIIARLNRSQKIRLTKFLNTLTLMPAKPKKTGTRIGGLSKRKHRGGSPEQLKMFLGGLRKGKSVTQSRLAADLTCGFIYGVKDRDQRFSDSWDKAVA